MKNTEYDLKVKLLTDILEKIRVLGVGELYVIHHELFGENDYEYDTGFIS
jgi:hypothetical protein